MSYKKPELLPLNRAIESIQGNAKEDGTPKDSGHVYKDTIAAYEADE